MTGEQLDEVARAAELHDVGKVGIPDAILNKPGELTQVEWDFIHQHTILGERILHAAPALRPIARLVRASHECWDGSGYPDRLAGEQIPLGSRIVAVCDAYEAMTTTRPYRAAVSDAEARRRAARGGRHPVRSRPSSRRSWTRSTTTSRSSSTTRSARLPRMCARCLALAPQHPGPPLER